jgi:hypothetical protein
MLASFAATSLPRPALDPVMMAMVPDRSTEVCGRVFL